MRLLSAITLPSCRNGIRFICILWLLLWQELITKEGALCPLTTSPARIYGLNGVKGELSAGADADIIVLDPDRIGHPGCHGQRRGHGPEPRCRNKRVF
jgi:dihydroorotase-like cyclic amidohydrolase